MDSNSPIGGLVAALSQRREPAGSVARGPGPFAHLAQEARDVSNSILVKLGDVQEAVSMLRKNEDTIRRYDSQTTVAGGTVDCTLGPPKPGSSWEIERISTEVTGGGAVGLKLYLDDPNDPTQKIESIGNPTDYSDGAANNLYVPPGRKVIARFTGVAADGRCTIACQIKERQLAPRHKARNP